MCVRSCADQILSTCTSGAECSGVFWLAIFLASTIAHFPLRVFLCRAFHGCHPCFPYTLAIPWARTAKSRSHRQSPFTVGVPDQPWGDIVVDNVELCTLPRQPSPIDPGAYSSTTVVARYSSYAVCTAAVGVSTRSVGLCDPCSLPRSQRARTLSHTCGSSLPEPPLMSSTAPQTR